MFSHHYPEQHSLRTWLLCVMPSRHWERSKAMIRMLTRSRNICEVDFRSDFWTACLPQANDLESPWSKKGVNHNYGLCALVSGIFVGDIMYIPQLHQRMQVAAAPTLMRTLYCSVMRSLSLKARPSLYHLICVTAFIYVDKVWVVRIRSRIQSAFTLKTANKIKSEGIQNRCDFDVTGIKILPGGLMR